MQVSEMIDNSKAITKKANRHENVEKNNQMLAMVHDVATRVATFYVFLIVKLWLHVFSD